MFSLYEIKDINFTLTCVNLFIKSTVNLYLKITIKKFRNKIKSSFFVFQFENFLNHGVKDL